MTSISKRLLFPSNSNSPLPPLLVSSNSSEINVELYDFIALALRVFVNPWWSKISRYDKHFLPQITLILTHVIRALEARVNDADLSPLVFQQIPLIVAQHYRDHRNATSKLSTSYASAGAISLPSLFHNLQPHLAISSDGVLNEEYFRHVVDIILKCTLPPEDYGPEAERIIVREIILKILITDVVPKISQPWFIERTILDLLGPQPDLPKKPPAPSPPFSFQNLVVVFLSVVQAISGACLTIIYTYKQTVSTIKRVNQSPPPTPPIPIAELTSARFSTSSVSPSTRLLDPISGLASSPTYIDEPLIMMSEIFTLHDRFASSVVINAIHMLLASFTPFLDKLLPHLLSTTLSPSLFLNVIRLSKRTLFPNGYPGPPPVEPSLEEQTETRARILAWKPNGLFPAHLFPLLLGPHPEETLEAVLDPLGNQECNVHLVVLILESVLVVLFPELQRGG